MMATAADLIVLDTLSMLYAHGHGLNGYCRPCRGYFGVLMLDLMLERGRDCLSIDMAPLRCLGCGGGARSTASSRRRRAAQVWCDPRHRQRRTMIVL
jgi:hypothetical protein